MQSVQWISHRGHCFNGVENTLNAFRDALSKGFTEFETDLRCSKDGHIVLSHDANLARHSDHPLAQKPVHSLTLKQLQAIPLHDGQQIMTLSELLDAFCQYRWIFDIKPESALATINALIDLWWPSKFKWFLTHQVRYLFWDAQHQHALQSKRHSVTCMAQLGECKRAGLANTFGLPFLSAVQAQKTYALPPRFYGINLYSDKIIQRYHRQQARVLAYLPDHPQQIEHAIAAGVDEILFDGAPIEQT